MSSNTVCHKYDLSYNRRRNLESAPEKVRFEMARLQIKEIAENEEDPSEGLLTAVGYFVLNFVFFENKRHQRIRHEFRKLAGKKLEKLNASVQALIEKEAPVYDPYIAGIRLGKSFESDLAIAMARQDAFPALFASFITAAVPDVAENTRVFLGHRVAEVLSGIENQEDRDMIHDAWIEVCNEVGFEPYAGLSTKIDKAREGQPVQNRIEAFTKKYEDSGHGRKKGPHVIDRLPQISERSKRGREQKTLGEQIRGKIIGANVDPSHLFVAAKGGKYFYGRDDSRLQRTKPKNRISFASIKEAEEAGYQRPEDLLIPV